MWIMKVWWKTKFLCRNNVCIHSAIQPLSLNLSQPKAYLFKQVVRVWTRCERYSSKWNRFICQHRDVQRTSSSRPETKQLWECNQQDISFSSDPLPDPWLRRLSHLLAAKCWTLISIKGLSRFFPRDHCLLFLMLCQERRIWERWSSIQIPHRGLCSAVPSTIHMWWYCHRSTAF